MERACRMERVGWSVSDGACRMERVGWSVSDGACRMERVGWSVSDGARRMGRVGWSESDGACRMERVKNMVLNPLLRSASSYARMNRTDSGRSSPDSQKRA
jgi:hypothetical protein